MHTPHAKAVELLSFRLGDEQYGVDIGHVQELRSYGSVTSIANTQSHIKGVVNLRGVIVPIVDLRIKFGQALPTYDHLTVVIIFCVDGRQVGAVVDGVSDVAVFDAGDIKPMPPMHASMHDDFLLGVGAREQEMIILVDIARLLADCLGLPEALAA